MAQPAETTTKSIKLHTLLASTMIMEVRGKLLSIISSQTKLQNHE